MLTSVTARCWPARASRSAASMAPAWPFGPMTNQSSGPTQTRRWVSLAPVVQACVGGSRTRACDPPSRKAGASGLPRRLSTDCPWRQPASRDCAVEARVVGTRSMGATGRCEVSSILALRFGIEKDRAGDGGGVDDGAVGANLGDVDALAHAAQSTLAQGHGDGPAQRRAHVAGGDVADHGGGGAGGCLVEDLRALGQHEAGVVRQQTDELLAV